MLNLNQHSFLKYASGFLLILILASCSSTRKIGKVEIKPMSSSKIMRKVISESPRYDTYASKRLSVDFDIAGVKNSATGQILIEHDNQMLINMRKLAFPVGKALVNKDSMFVVNYLQKNFMIGDLNSLKKYVGFDFNFEMLQALFTADIRSMTSVEAFDKELTSTIDSGMYRIDSQFDRKIDKALTKGKERKLNRYMEKMDESEFLEFSLWIDPQLFAVRKILLKNLKSNEEAILTYDQYEEIQRRLFPGKITFQYLSKDKKIEIGLELSKQTVNKKEDFSFSIPEKYQRLNLGDL